VYSVAWRRSRKKPQLGLQVELLPPNPDDPDFVKSLNEVPGILALAMKKKVNAEGKTTFEGIPFVVPGARFNEVSSRKIWVA
jgi:alpha,alpha-trehalase